MPSRSPAPPKFSRRSFVTGATATSLPAHKLAGLSDPFELWWREREDVLHRLKVTSENNEAHYEPLMDALARTERLIFETPSNTPAALRMKGRLLLWLMEQERHDGLAAMRHIAAYFETLA